jgi:hypothetical protein
MATNFVNINDKDFMISLGIHPKNAEPRDPSVWTKTAKEKNDVKKMRLRHKKERLTGSSGYNNPIPFYSKLIVHIKADPIYALKVNKDGTPDTSTIKTTHSITCGQSDIPFILSKFVDSKGSNIVVKYQWNEKTYKPDTLPFWGR